MLKPLKESYSQSSTPNTWQSFQQEHNKEKYKKTLGGRTNLISLAFVPEQLVIHAYKKTQVRSRSIKVYENWNARTFTIWNTRTNLLFFWCCMQLFCGLSVVSHVQDCRYIFLATEMRSTSQGYEITFSQWVWKISSLFLVELALTSTRGQLKVSIGYHIVAWLRQLFIIDREARIVIGHIINAGWFKGKNENLKK